MADRQGIALRSRPVEVWPPDDTEESVLGTNLHQTTITNLRLGLNEVAATLEPPGGPRPWQAGSQTLIMGLRRLDGSRYRVLPDVLVYRQPLAMLRASQSLEADGPPVLIVEVASDETYRSDLDTSKGKAYSYAAAGVMEYLVIDPTGAFVPEGGRGWRLAGGSYHSWRQERSGYWQSRELGVAIGLEGLQVAVFAANGRRLLREGEIEQALAAKDQQIAELAERDRRWIEEMARREQERAEELTRLEFARLEELTRRELARAEELIRLEQERAEELARKDAELDALRRRLSRLEQEE